MLNGTIQMKSSNPHQNAQKSFDIQNDETLPLNGNTELTSMVNAANVVIEPNENVQASNIGTTEKEFQIKADSSCVNENQATWNEDGEIVNEGRRLQPKITNNVRISWKIWHNH